MTTHEGVNDENVTAWMTERIEGLVPPLSFDLVAHGRSNLTYVVTDARGEAGEKYVLRRPPLGHVLASAHDITREHRCMDALWPTDVPVPKMIGLCTDPEVNGADFYVMSFVEGTIAKNPTELEKFDSATRRRISESLVDTLAVLHQVDPDSVGLGDLGKKDDYLARQLRRWMGQVDKGSERELPELRAVHGLLEATMPTQQGAGIVHADFRLDNCMLADDGSIAAVLDWELCTLGDVLADLGGLIMYWTEAEGFLSTGDVIERYSRTSDRDLSDLDYYVAFANWRLACIVEGVRTRFEKGAMGKDIGAELEGYGAMMDAWIATAAQLLSR